VIGTVGIAAGSGTGLTAAPQFAQNGVSPTVDPQRVQYWLIESPRSSLVRFSNEPAVAGATIQRDTGFGTVGKLSTEGFCLISARRPG
jgi:hypothetical protein